MTKSGRQAAREALAAAQEEAARLARANEEDLAGFFSAHGRLSEVDDWLAERMAALTAQAEERRAGLRRRCGAALRGMRGRGQSVAGLAAMAGITPRVVRELIKEAESEPATPDAGADSEQAVSATLTQTNGAHADTAGEAVVPRAAPVNEAVEPIGETSAI